MAKMVSQWFSVWPHIQLPVAWQLYRSKPYGQCVGLDEIQDQGDLLHQHGGVEEQDHEAVGNQDERQQLPKEAGGVNAQEDS
jgi:hypothetical protein